MFQLNYNKVQSKKVSPILLTLSTCFYVLKSKFPVEQYVRWINNLLAIVNDFNLVIYTEASSFNYIAHIIDLNNPCIKVVFKPLTEFKMYKYRDQWINNHDRNKIALHEYVSWELNMLWNEKVFFVEDTIKRSYFNTLYYGWCDIGYFRNKPNNINTKELMHWPDYKKLLQQPFLSDIIHYARVQKDDQIYNDELTHIRQHYAEKLLEHPLDSFVRNYFAGGFFILKPNMINKYATMYEAKLQYYFNNKYTIKDDQTIITDIIATNTEIFYIHDILETQLDEWFAFQKILM